MKPIALPASPNNATEMPATLEPILAPASVSPISVSPRQRNGNLANTGHSLNASSQKNELSNIPQSLVRLSEFTR
jgi:hypothetical protein